MAEEPDFTREQVETPIAEADDEGSRRIRASIGEMIHPTRCSTCSYKYDTYQGIVCPQCGTANLTLRPSRAELRHRFCVPDFGYPNPEGVAAPSGPSLVDQVTACKITLEALNTEAVLSSTSLSTRWGRSEEILLRMFSLIGLQMPDAANKEGPHGPA